MKEGGGRAGQWLARGAAVVVAGTAVVFVAAAATSGGGGTAVLAGVRRGQARLQELYKWKGYSEDPNPFADETAHKAPKWRKYEEDENVFAKVTEEPKEWEGKGDAPDDNVLAEMPKKYPFDDSVGGHVWRTWDEGDKPAEMLREENVFDDGSTEKAEEAEKKVREAQMQKEADLRDKNVLERPEDEVEGAPWEKTPGSVTDKNVFDSMVYHDDDGGKS